MKVYLETFGCQMNRLDSELVIGALCAAGHELVAGCKDADAVLYNTCSVRRHAEQKVHSRLGADGRRKSEKSDLIVGVLGCMAQREGEQLLKQYSHVNFVCGPGQLYRIGEMIELAANGGRVAGLDPSRSQEPDLAAEGEMDLLDLSRDPTNPVANRSQAFVRVMRGCDNFCSYCIVPFVRGRERSRDPSHIVEETRRLVEAGRGEITLLGQTVNRYRWSAGDVTVRFSDLLRKVSEIPSLRRLRFITSHPLSFTDDIFEAMRDLPNVCQYIHCPAQSGSDAVLKRMRRGYSRADYDRFVDRARAMVPEAVLAGDFIVGFPGETAEDHLASKDLIFRSGYKNSFIFKYSPRPGTLAARNFPDDVPLAVKRSRNAELLSAQKKVSLSHHQAYIGKSVEVLVEGPSVRSRKHPSEMQPGSSQLVGRTAGDHIVVFDGPSSLAGQYLFVKVIEATSLTLFGELPGAVRATPGSS